MDVSDEGDGLGGMEVVAEVTAGELGFGWQIDFGGDQ